jgi:iron complex transport system substrate-binding protein
MDRLYREIDELSQSFDVADRGQVLVADFMARETRLRNRVSVSDKKLSYALWFSGPSPTADADLGGRNGASGFIADLLGGFAAVTAKAPWPTLGWESIIAINPDVIVVAGLDRNRRELDRPEAKIKFLTIHPAVSQLSAVRDEAIVVMAKRGKKPRHEDRAGLRGIRQRRLMISFLGMREMPSLSSSS